MLIGIDARMMGYGFGIARYILEFVHQLKEVDHTNDYVLFLTDVNFDLVQVPTNWRKVKVNLQWYSWQEQFYFGRYIKRERIDLMHFPHWNVPIFCRTPFVLTVHDLIMYHFPRPEATLLGPIKFFIKDMAHRFILRIAVKRARHIIATSEFTKQDIVNETGVKPSNITVTYQAPFSINQRLDSLEVRERYNLPGKYVLCVGSAYPHKNLARLLDAWSLVEEELSDYTLVLIGNKTTFFERLMESDGFRSLSKLRYLGFVSDDELDSLYREAELLVLPSLYEGFGLTPLEALSRGTPVAVSSASCLPEILGEAAVYFDPNNVDNMASVIVRSLQDQDMRRDILSASKYLLPMYSWSDLTKKTVSIYGSVAK